MKNWSCRVLGLVRRVLGPVSAPALLAIAACGPEPARQEPPPSEADTFAVSTTFAVRCGEVDALIIQPDRERVRVALTGDTIDLVHVRAASGAKYQVNEDSSTFFWTQGDRAMLQVRGERFPECVRVTRPGPTFTATGNEPGWSLEVSDSGMVLIADYGETRAVMPRADPTTTEIGLRYESRSDERVLIVTVTDELCADDMTGMPFPARVIIEVDGRTLRGCGGRPSALLEGREWVVESLAGDAVNEGTLTTMTFGDGRVAGLGSCNEYSAGYTLTGEGLNVGPPTATRRACAETIMRQEAVFLELLANSSRFSIGTDGTLTLYDADGRTVTARR